MNPHEPSHHVRGESIDSPTSNQKPPLPPQPSSTSSAPGGRLPPSLTTLTSSFNLIGINTTPPTTADFSKYSQYFPETASQPPSTKDDQPFLQSPTNTITPSNEFSNLGLDFFDTQSNFSSALDDESMEGATVSTQSSSESGESFALRYERYMDDLETMSTYSNSSRRSETPSSTTILTPPTTIPPPPPPPPKRQASSANISPPKTRPPPPPRKSSAPMLSSRSMSSPVRRSPSPFDNFANNRSTVLTKLSQSKSKKDVISKLDAALLSVEDALKEKVRNLMNFQDQISAETKAMTNAMSRWESHAAWNLVNAGRSYFQNKLLCLESECEIAKLHCKCFSRKFKELRRVSVRIKSNESAYEFDDLVFSVEAAINTAANIRLPRRIHGMREASDGLAVVVEELKLKYESLEKERTRSLSQVERKQHLVTILIQILEGWSSMCDELYYHGMDENNLQLAFEEMLFDSRYGVSKIVLKWEKVLKETAASSTPKKGNDDVTVANIGSFVKKLTKKMCSACDILPGSEFYEDNFPQCLYLMICRCLLPRIRVELEECMIREKNGEAYENDQIYARRLSWMVSLSQSQLHIENEYRCPDDGEKLNEEEKTELKPSKKKIPYHDAISKLTCIDDTLIPHEMMMLMVTSVRTMQKLALVYAGASSDKDDGLNAINGDVLFPIVVYCVVQSGISKWHRLFEYLEVFLPPDAIERGQSGYCLSLFRAAAGYVMQQKPSNFGLDDDFES